MNPRKSTLSLSKREKMRRKPFNRRNSRSTSLRLLYNSLLYSHGSTLVETGGTTGANPNSNASWRVSLPSYARSITMDRSFRCGPRRWSSLRPSGASWACPGEREGHGRSSICGNHMNLGSPSAPRLSDRLWSVFFNAPVPSGCTLTMVLSIETALSLTRTICSRCRCSNTLSRTPFLAQRFIRV